jgi:hypothetical protein
MTQPVSGSQGVDIPDDHDFGVDPYGPEEAVSHACGLLDVIKQEWGDSWTEHDQRVRAGLSRVLTRKLLSERALRDAETRGWNQAIEAAAKLSWDHEHKYDGPIEVCIRTLARPSQSPEEGQ